MSKFLTGHINLFKIFEFVSTNPQITSRKMMGMKKYTSLVNELVENIPQDKAGWYLWGKFNDMGWWETIYLGKSGNKKTSSLQARLKEEIIDERIAFWSFVFGKETALKQHAKLYDDKYKKECIRHIRKSGTQFIVWISIDSISEKDVVEEEKTLIEIYRPSYNAQRIRYPSKSPITEKIIRLIDKEIEKIKTP